MMTVAMQEILATCEEPDDMYSALQPCEYESMNSILSWFKDNQNQAYIFKILNFSERQCHVMETP